MKTISKKTANDLMNAFAAVYMDTHETTGVYETDKEVIENAARETFVAFCSLVGIGKVIEE